MRRQGARGGGVRTRARQCGFAALGAAVLAAATLPGLALAEEPELPERPQQNLFGVTGLIETPSAEMQPDGQFTFTTSYFGGFHRNTASVQFLPGIEGAFRYSILDEILGSSANPRTLYDRSFDVKVRLIDEGPHWPAVAVGLQDFLGTGIY